MDSIYKYFGIYQDYWLFWVVAALALIGSIIIIGLICVGIYDLMDKYNSTWERSIGVVIQHSYQPATTSTGYGIAAGSNGPTTIVTSSSTSEEYILFVRETLVGAGAKGHVYKFEMEMDEYFNHQDGMKVEFWKRIGRLSHSVIDQKLI